MSSEPGALYGRLAPWWPLVSPVREYREEASFVLGLLPDAGPQRQTLLELGSGGGHNATYLAERFDLTLVDLSEQMLAMSRRLVPGAEHVCADLRSVRLGRRFDVVFVHDAIDYMTTELDLRDALASAFLHLVPGGTAVFLPDATREIFEPGHDAGGSDGADGRGVRFLEWTVDPDPAGTVVRTDYVFLLRHRDGQVEAVHDTHHTGLFPRQTWLRLLRQVGFDARRITETTSEDRVPRDVFLASRPR